MPSASPSTESISRRMVCRLAARSTASGHVASSDWLTWLSGGEVSRRGKRRARWWERFKWTCRKSYGPCSLHRLHCKQGRPSSRGGEGCRCSRLVSSGAPATVTSPDARTCGTPPST
ncbi:unnamed protein product [Closterium sp. NIES-54]